MLDQRVDIQTGMFSVPTGIGGDIDRLGELRSAFTDGLIPMLLNHQGVFHGPGVHK